jgi:formylglycine-generating enzyme required for sulfatase activity
MTVCLEKNEKYEFDEEIGSGAHSVVFRALDRRRNLVVAFKRLLQSGASDSDWASMVDAFHFNANVSIRLDHRNIARTFERGEDERGPYAVTAFVDGQTLSEYRKRQGGRLSTAESVSIALDIAHALFHAHALGATHGRISPRNILMAHCEPVICDRPRVYPVVTDFCLWPPSRPADGNGMAGGLECACYRAPESMDAEMGGSFSHDVYALGKILYELVTGERPDVIAPGKIPPRIGLAEVVITCTNNNPSERYLSPRDLVDSLESIGWRSGSAISSPVGDDRLCPFCGVPNPVDEQFCVRCGSGIARRCPECGSPDLADERYCHGCGTDAATFACYAESLTAMERLCVRRRWQEILALHETLPLHASLPGKIGGALQENVLAMKTHALERLAERNRLAAVARASFAMGQVEAALATATQAMEIAPSDDLSENSSNSLEALAETSQTLIHLLKSARFCDALAVVERVRTEGFPDEGVCAIARRVEETRTFFHDRLGVAVALIDGRRITEANEALAEVLDLCPWSTQAAARADKVQRLRLHLEANLRRAQAAIDANCWKEAHDAAQIAVSVEPSNPSACALLSQVSDHVDQHNRRRLAVAASLLIAASAIWLALRAAACRINDRIYSQAIALAEMAKYDDALEIYRTSYRIPGLMVFPRPLPDAIGEHAVLQRQTEFSALVAKAAEAKEAADWASCLRLAGEALSIDLDRHGDPRVDRWLPFRQHVRSAFDHDQMIRLANELKTEAQRNLVVPPPEMGIDLSFVEPGSFIMGVHAEEDDESPEHEVRLSSPFWIGKHEITNRAYDRFLAETGYQGRRDADESYLRHHSGAIKHASPEGDYPVVYVSWKNAARFCAWLTEREKKAGRLTGNFVYRLPTEAEWEFAARGGILSRRTIFSGDDSANAVAWHLGNSDSGTSKVGLKAKNELGLFDMSGNVWEWCHDWYGQYDSLATSDPTGPKIGSRRVCRGGSCLYLAPNSRVANRYCQMPSFTEASLGFRIVIARPLPE